MVSVSYLKLLFSVNLEHKLNRIANQILGLLLGTCSSRFKSRSGADGMVN